MKKFSLLILMMIALAGLVFAQERKIEDSSVVVRWDGTEVTTPLIYHLEVWDQSGAATDISGFLNPVNDLRKYGSVCFLIHADNGYIVSLYASAAWEPGLQKPEGIKPLYSAAGDSKQIIRSLLDSKEFKKYITRSRFLEDLESTFAGLQ
ncbi:hypothetical protein AGMMS50255_5940 [Spirochaetia bacterium]|nr:hypothetical protein AGMMS50255_5940 [Spirochaetia bacterium]